MRVVVYGSRPDGHAKVVVELFQGVDGVDIVGMIDDFPENLGRTICGLPILGEFSSLKTLTADGVEGVALGFGESRGRARTCERVVDLGLALPTLIHPTASVVPSASLSAGTQVLPMAFVGPDAKLMDGALVNTGAVVEHDVEIGRGGVIGPSATLAGRVKVDQEAFVGAGATILPDRRVGAGAFVGAGAVVTRDVRPGEVVAGVPARPLS